MFGPHAPPDRPYEVQNKKRVVLVKKFFLIAASMIALSAVSSAASATDLNINLQGTLVGQQVGPVVQKAASAAAAIGSTGTNANITSTAVNGANLATVEQTIDQLDSSFVNGNGLATVVSQSTASANQAALSIAGSGNLGAGSSISSTAANLANSANVTVHVSQH